MSLSALGWLGLYCLSACLTFVNPVFGMLGYFVEYYRRPQLQWWGRQLPSLRWNLIISMIWGVSFLLRRSSLRPLRPIRNLAFPWLLSINVLMVFVTLVFAVAPLRSQNFTIQWTKLAMIVPLLMIGCVRTRGQFNLYVAANMLGALWWGYDAWTNPVRDSGRLIYIGSGDSLHDNAASIHLLTILPLTAIYVLVAKEKWLRAIAAVSLPFIVNTLILCNSRGAMVSLLVASGAGMVLIQRGYRLRFAAVGLAAVVGFFLLADDTFIRRQQTTANYENDGSAQGRISSWKGAAALVADYPFGAGGRGFHTLSPIYAAEVVAKTRDEGRAPHNTYMLVASEWGVLGLILWIGFHTSTFVMLHRIKARAKATDFYYWRALAMQLSLIAVLIASTFTDRLYAEAPYWLAAMVYALQRIQHTDYAEDAEATTSDATTVVPPPERAAVSSAA